MNTGKLNINCSPGTFNLVLNDAVYRRVATQQVLEEADLPEHQQCGGVVFTDENGASVEELLEPIQYDETAGEMDEICTPISDVGDGKPYWNEGAVKLMLTLVEQLQQKVGKTISVKTKSKMYALVSERMAANNYIFTPNQIENKFRGMERQYKKIVLNDGQTHRNSKTYRFEKELAELLGRKKKINPKHTLGSQAANRSSYMDQVAVEELLKIEKYDATAGEMDEFCTPILDVDDGKTFWSEGAIRLMLTSVKQLQQKVGKTSSVKTKSKMYALVSERMAVNNYIFTPNQIENKFRGMVRQYKKTVLRNRKTYPFEKELAELLGRRVSVDNDQSSDTDQVLLDNTPSCSSQTANRSSYMDQVAVEELLKLEKGDETAGEMDEFCTPILDVDDGKTFWSEGAIKLMLTSVKQLQQKVGKTSSVRTKSKMYALVSERMAAYNYIFTPNQIENKCHAMVRQYKKTVLRNRKTYPFEKEMAKLLGRKKKINPKHTLESQQSHEHSRKVSVDNDESSEMDQVLLDNTPSCSSQASNRSSYMDQVAVEELLETRQDDETADKMDEFCTPTLDVDDGRPYWSEGAVKLMLTSVKQLQQKVGKTISAKTKSKMYVLVSERMAAYNYIFTPNQIKNKFRAMERQYKKCILNNRRTGKNRKTYPFEKELGEVLRRKKGINPKHTLQGKQSHEHSRRVSVDNDKSSDMDQVFLDNTPSCSSQATNRSSDMDQVDLDNTQSCSSQAPKRGKIISKEEAIENFNKMVKVKTKFYNKKLEHLKKKEEREQKKLELLEMLANNSI